MSDTPSAVRRRLTTLAATFALLTGLIPGLPASQVRAATSVFINEIHYDNTGTDAGEAIEVAGPAATDLTGWSLVLYNGANGAVYRTDDLSGVIPDQQNGFGTVVVNYPVNGIQNGAPDGIALVNGSTVVQFLSYEGTFAAVGGPADGMTSTDIGVSESGSEPLGQSLQLTGSGTTYEDFSWAGPQAETFGAVNTGQAFSTEAPDVVINEILASHTGTDNTEFIELYGTPGTPLAGISLIVVESDAGASQGAIDRRIDFTAEMLGGNGFFLIGNPSGLAANYSVTPNLDFGNDYLENSSMTVALVETSSITGTSVTGSEVVLDSVGLNDGGAGDSFFFSAPVIGPDDSFFPAGARRAVDGVDTDTVADWVLADFNLGPDNTPTRGTPFGPAAVLVDCGPALSVAEGFSASRTISASDADGTVVDIAIDSITPATADITLGATTPAPAVGGTASAELSVADAATTGTYEVTIVATNDDEPPQTGTCSLSVTVSPVLTIGEVQGAVEDTDAGATHRSSFAPSSGNGTGATVYIRGVVTQRGRFPTSSGSDNFGFWLQSRVGADDGDPQSSDGILVFIGGFTTVLREAGGPTYFPVVGDQIVLRGNVVEFFSLTELSSPRLVAVEEQGIDVDDPSEIVTTEAAPDDDLAEANRFWERHEGMRMHLDAGAQVVAARDVFASTHDGELWVIRGDHPIAQRASPYERLVYRDTHPLDDIGPAGSFDNGNGMRIMLQSHGLKWLANDRELLIAPARTYDTVTNELTGAVYFAFSKYGVEVEQQLQLENGVDPALNAPPSAVIDGVEFSSSDYNVENLYDFRDDPNDGCDFAGNAGCPGVSPPFDYVPASEEAYQQHLADLAAQIVGPMHAPDLLMIQEAEDQDICWVEADVLACGPADDADGKPDTLQDLALAISAAGGPTYDAAYDRNGADDRGIISAFLYRTDTVELVEPDAGDPVLGDSPTIDYAGDGLPYNADVQNPKALNAELPAGVPGPIDRCDEPVTCVFTRDPQVGLFRVWRDGIGTSVFTELYAISNHFSSGPDNRVGQRTQQAAYNAAIAEAILADDPDARIINAGDFNVFPRPDDPFVPGDPRYPSDQLGPMYDAGLHNLWDVLVSEVPQSAYSYSFVGMVQTLDMQWADANQFADLVQVRAAHINADFPADYDGDVARGASDHDPQVARWFTDVTFDRLHALVDHYVATGQLDADKAFLFHDRLDKAAAFAAQGKTRTAQAQLEAFGNQAWDYATSEAAAAMEKEGDRLASLL